MLENQGQNVYKCSISQQRYFFTDASGTSNGCHLSRGEALSLVQLHRKHLWVLLTAKAQPLGFSFSIVTHIPGGRRFMFSSPPRVRVCEQTHWLSCGGQRPLRVSLSVALHLISF